VETEYAGKGPRPGVVPGQGRFQIVGEQVDSVSRMTSTDRVARYQAMVDELTQLIRTAGTSTFEAREQDVLNRVHQEYFAAVADLS
jgi:cob(I)alamin adenosyltransferase